VFLYNPLNVHGELFALFAAASQRDVAGQRRGDLLALYRPFALGRRLAGVAIPAALEEDARPLTARFRAFFPGLVELSDLRSEIGEVPIVFPQVAVADARCIELDGHQAVFVSSAMLDAIELFASTVSICARLNQIALPSVTALEERLPDQVALAWLTLVGDAWPGMTVAALLERGSSRDELLDVLVDESDWAADGLRPGLTCYRLSHLLMQLMMRAIRRSARRGWDGAHGYPREPIGGALPVERDFLAVLALAFVVLHEIGHLALGHNEIGLPSPDGLEQALAGTGAQQVALHGTQASFELAADVFAVEVVEGRVRDPLLEAATLWCAALERAHVAAGERFDDLARLTETPDAYPSFAVRVWFLNGRLSTGRRAGAIAQQITSQAEGAAHELEEGADDPEREVEAFNALWDIARAASDGDAAVFAERVAARPRRGGPPSSDQQALERGGVALEAGLLDDAEREFRAVAASGDAAIAGTAHGLVGRVLEQRGDLRGAEEQFRRGDALGDGDAANDLGVMLADRGDVAEAQDAYRRAEARGNAPAAYNLGALHHHRGEDDEAAAAFERADALGDAKAAEIVGMFAYERGELDRAEAAWRRADARGAVAAANNLGVLLQQRGDLDGAAAAWTRAAERGAVDAVHNLGNLRELRGDLEGAQSAYMEAVARGRDGSTGNLAAVRELLRERDEREAALRRGAEEGDAEAAYQLGFARARRRDSAGAVAAWEVAERLGHTRAANELGLVLHDAGDLEGAEAAYRRGAAHGHARAIFNLGVLLGERGDEDGAQDAWRSADALGDMLAATNVGSMLELVGDVRGATEAYARAEERGDELAVVRLGHLLEEHGDVAGAEAAYRRADERGDAYATTALGRLLRERDDLTGAEDAWRRADALGNRDAAANLGALLRSQGNLDGAEAAYRRAVERGHPSAYRDLSFVLAAKGHQRDASRTFMSRPGERI
jgi:tetratricopeptide (TPR) repeat protein